MKSSLPLFVIHLASENRSHLVFDDESFPKLRTDNRDSLQVLFLSRGEWDDRGV